MTGLCAHTEPERDSIFTEGPADLLDHAAREIAIGSKLGISPTHLTKSYSAIREATATERK